MPICPPLTGPAIVELSRLLSRASNFEHLQAVVQASTGDDLFRDYVGPGEPLLPTIRKLLNALEETQTTHLFLAEFVRTRPGRDDVRDAVRQLFPGALEEAPRPVLALSAQTAGVRQAAQPGSAYAPGFERNVRPNLHKVDPAAWAATLGEIGRRVCRVEIDGNAAGTGFLVGAAAVLTNYHVVRPVLDGKLGRVACRFGYQTGPAGARADGEVIGLAAEGCLDSAPYGAAEASPNPDQALPTEDQLDFALLNLSRPAERGWVPMRADAPLPELGAPLLILQHPDGGPLKLALDTQAVQFINANATRIRYFTNTDPGSSGSPCFSMDWELLALHHLGDPAWNAKYNQGVPIGLIRRRLDSKGLGGLLGPP